MLDTNPLALKMIGKVHQDYCRRSLVATNGGVSIDVVVHPSKMRLFSKEYGKKRQSVDAWKKIREREMSDELEDESLDDTDVEETVNSWRGRIKETRLITRLRRRLR